MDVKAVGNYIWLERLESPKMIGGIELSEGAREEMAQRPIGVVVSVGPLVNHVDAPDSFAEAPEHPEPIRKGMVVAFCGDKARGIHGRDGAPLWFCTRLDIAAVVVTDPEATEAERKALSERHAKLRAEMQNAQAAANAQRIMRETGALAQAAGNAGIKLVE